MIFFKKLLKFESIYSYLFSILLFLYFFKRDGYKIYDLTNYNFVSNEFFIKNNIWNSVFAPFLQVPNYFLQLEEYRIQIISWFVWFFIIGSILFIVFRYKNRLKNQANSEFFYYNSSSVIFIKILVLFFSLVSYVVFFPYSGNKIQSKNKDFVMVNFHSHTYYSWDAMASFDRSINFHKANGYDAYFITEHDKVLDDSKNINYFQNKGIFVGLAEEVPEQNGLFYLFFNINQAVTRTDLDSQYTKTMENVRSQNGAVATALWWEDVSLKDLLTRKFTSVEISNMGHRDYRGKDVYKAINVFKSKNINMLGTVDWHGWGYQSNTWTAVKIPNWKNMDYKSKNNSLIAFLNGKYSSKVLEYKILNQNKSFVRYLFEPFFGMFYTFSSQTFFCLIAWFFWILVTGKIIQLIYSNHIPHIVWFGIFLINGFISCKFYLDWQKLKLYNEVLKDLSLYFLIISFCSLIVAFVYFRMRNKFKNKEKLV